MSVCRDLVPRRRLSPAALNRVAAAHPVSGTPHLQRQWRQYDSETVLPPSLTLLELESDSCRRNLAGCGLHCSYMMQRRYTFSLPKLALPSFRLLHMRA
jgi:hypothetical protein